MLAGVTQQPFTAEDVARAYALLFLPFLEFEAVGDRAALFRHGLELALEFLGDAEERIVARAILLHPEPLSERQRRLRAREQLELPPLGLKGLTERKVEALQKRAFGNLSRLLVSTEFATRFRSRYAGLVRNKPEAHEWIRGMEWLSYARIETWDPSSATHHASIAIRLRSRLPGLRVIALPFLWPPVLGPVQLERLPEIATFSPGHSFVDFRPDPRPGDTPWFVAIFHLGRLAMDDETKLVFREFWAGLTERPDPTVAFRTGRQPLRTLHLSTTVPSAMRLEAARGSRWDLDTPAALQADELPIVPYRGSRRLTMRVMAPASISRYAIEWLEPGSVT
jgi:hypothetical protein